MIRATTPPAIARPLFLFRSHGFHSETSVSFVLIISMFVRHSGVPQNKLLFDAVINGLVVYRIAHGSAEGESGLSKPQRNQGRPGISPAYIRHDGQLQRRHPVEVDGIVFDLPGRARRAEGVLLAKDFPVGPPTVFRPSQHKLMGPLPSLFLKYEMNESECLRFIKEQADRLLPGLHRPASPAHRRLSRPTRRGVPSPQR